jgi:menaquinone-dependent protoporphyrinogen oxidase
VKHAAFVSVGGASAASQNATDPEKRAHYALQATQTVEAFFKETGWTARHVEYVGGALLFTRYHWLVRFVMKRIAASEGLSTDTSKDHDYTNWLALDRFAAGLAVSEAPAGGAA